MPVLDNEEPEVTGSSEDIVPPLRSELPSGATQPNGQAATEEEEKKNDNGKQAMNTRLRTIMSGDKESLKADDLKKVSSFLQSTSTSEKPDLQKPGPDALQSEEGNTSFEYVKATLLDMKNLDAALEKHLHRGKSGQFGSFGATMKRKVEEWEIDPTKLVLKNVIAQGTYGTVHRGLYDGQDVAVKLLDWGEEDTMTRERIQTIRTDFRKEVEVWYKLDHPNVTKFIGASMGSSNLQIPSFLSGDDGFVHVASNICCVVVEFIAGGTLKDFLIRNRRKKLTFKMVIRLALDLSRGLEYLHAKKIVHRDVKSENMLLDLNRNLKIADFGVARVEASNPKDMTGQTGTLGYMAPEILNHKPYNRKCDVYSFGIVLWEIYCCAMPYPDLSFVELTHAVVHTHLRPTIPRCCPAALGHVMKKCWDQHPDRRPEMSHVVQLIEAIDTSKGGGMIPDDSQPHGCYFCGRYRGP